MEIVMGLPGSKWSASEIRILTENYGKMTVKELTNLLPNRSFAGIQDKAKRMKLHSLLVYNQFTSPGSLRYIDRKLFPQDQDIEDVWKVLEQFQEKCRTLTTRQDEVTVEMAEGPVVLCFLADLHIGAISGKYKELRERIDLLSRTEKTYVVSCGDTVDNYLPDFHSPGQFGDMVPPEIQKQLVEYIFEKLNGKIVALVQGCHDEASHTTDDFDWTKYLSIKLQCANLGFGGFINVLCKDQTYRVSVRHKFRYGSSLNLTHTVKRMREQLGDFDIGVVAHNHQASVEELAMPDKSRIFIRPGSFKGDDRYARQRGFMDTGAQIPSVILFPETRRMIPFLNLDDGIKVLKSIV